MNAKDFTTTFIVDESPEKVFDSINNVRGWWSEDFAGNSKQKDGEFEVRFGDVHYSKQKLVDLIPNRKVVWLVTDSRLNFLKNKSEWTGTTIDFEVYAERGKTQIRFSHLGLLPEIECFTDCTKGWNFYLDSLMKMITSGKGHPNQVESN